MLEAFAEPADKDINLSGGILHPVLVGKNTFAAGVIGAKVPSGKFIVNIKKATQPEKHKVSIVGYAFVKLSEEEDSDGAPSVLLKKINRGVRATGAPGIEIGGRNKYAIVMLIAEIPIDAELHCGDLLDGQFFPIHDSDKKLKAPLVLMPGLLTGEDNEVWGISAETELSPDKLYSNDASDRRSKIKLLKDIAPAF